MKFLKRTEEDFSLQLTPLIDVVFLLLIFFMVSTAFVDFTRQIDINLPKTAAGDLPAEKKVFTIEISREKEIFLDGKQVTFTELEERIAGSGGAKRSVIIRADSEVDYGTTVGIMGMCKLNGIEEIGLSVSER
ncbi:MAG: biopolymer transporter ExbD [Nitrospinota bacterium]|nr:biopolymer transporter ExbD [Nitrospinota bacterium]